MKVAIAKKNKVVIDEIPIPKLGDYDILVRMRACGICGSDLEKVYGRYGVTSMRLGHEPAGEIVAIGKNVKDFNVGERVFVHHHVACYECNYCRHGDYTMCRYYQISNIEPCGLAELFLVPEWNIKRGGVIKLPEYVSFSEAALIEPLACCIKAVDKASIIKGDNIAIIGIGPTGMLQSMLAKLYGAIVFAIDINDFRLDFARRYGVDHVINLKLVDVKEYVIKKTNEGVDSVIISTSNPDAFRLALSIVRSGGKIVLFGVPPKDTIVNIDLNYLFVNEIKIIPSLAASEFETRRAFELIANKKIDVESIITHRFKLEESNEAFKIAHEARNAMKVIITND